MFVKLREKYGELGYSLIDKIKLYHSTGVVNNYKTNEMLVDLSNMLLNKDIEVIDRLDIVSHIIHNSKEFNAKYGDSFEDI